MNLEFCQYITQKWVCIRQTKEKDVIWHAEFSQMVSFSLQGILVD